MGTAHVLMHVELVKKLENHADLRLLSIADFGEDELHHALVESPILSEGYHGQQFIVVNDDGSIGFRRDVDV